MGFKTNGKRNGYLALLVTSTVWGTTWVASKIGIREMPALQMAAIRQMIGGLIFVLFFMLIKKLPLPDLKQFRWLFVMSILMFVMANGLSTWSLQYIPTGMSALVGALYPLSVVVIERVFFKRKKLTPVTVFGFLMGITGIGIVFYENAFHHNNPNFVWGILLSAAAMLAWAVGTVFIGRNKASINSYYGIGWQMLISSFVLFLLAQFTQPTIAISAISFKSWLVILYLVGFGSIIAFIAFIYSMKKLSPSIASLYAYINPLIAMLVATFILDEKLTMNIVWGSIVTLTGVFLVNYSIRRSIEKKSIEVAE